MILLIVELKALLPETKSGRGGGGKHPLITESLLELFGIMRKHLSLPFSHFAMLQFSGFIEPEQAKHSKLLTPAN